jgi:hypothetical protein
MRQSPAIRTFARPPAAGYVRYYRSCPGLDAFGAEGVAIPPCALRVEDR